MKGEREYLKHLSAEEIATVAQGALLAKDEQIRQLKAENESLRDSLEARTIERDVLREEIERLRKGIAAVEALMSESYGVAGLHMNGDNASWGELSQGGRFEEWLIDFSAALEAKP